MNRQIGAYLKYSLLFAMLLAGGVIGRSAAQGASFTYQGRLQEGGTNANGNYINAEMVNAFISSGEYRNRFDP